MKRSWFLILLLTLVGCTTVTVPGYIQDQYPYKRNVYGEFDQVLKATVKAFEAYGWQITNSSDPALYEQGKEMAQGAGQQVLLFTDMREHNFFIGTNYYRLNAYVRSLSNGEAEVELRYFKMTSLPFKNFSHYRHDKLVGRILTRIEKELNSEK
ncbi:MAG: hypothetical protein Q7S13_06760 [Candidatus Omnitrophota bacterium]|nr:hypothetical protein [Candidatus Omnitrophota bacterium]